MWGKIPGHERNEPLDCRNYALAGLRILNPDMDAAERRLRGQEEKSEGRVRRLQRTKRRSPDTFDDW